MTVPAIPHEFPHCWLALLRELCTALLRRMTGKGGLAENLLSVPEGPIEAPCPHCSTSPMTLTQVAHEVDARVYVDADSSHTRHLDKIMSDRGMSPLKAGDSYEAMQRKMLRFEEVQGKHSRTTSLASQGSESTPSPSGSIPGFLPPRHPPGPGSRGRPGSGGRFGSSGSLELAAASASGDALPIVDERERENPALDAAEAEDGSSDAPANAPSSGGNDMASDSKEGPFGAGPVPAGAAAAVAAPGGAALSSSDAAAAAAAAAPVAAADAGNIGSPQRGPPSGNAASSDPTLTPRSRGDDTGTPEASPLASRDAGDAGAPGGSGGGGGGSTEAPAAEADTAGAGEAKSSDVGDSGGAVVPADGDGGEGKAGDGGNLGHTALPAGAEESKQELASGDPPGGIIDDDAPAALDVSVTEAAAPVEDDVLLESYEAMPSPAPSSGLAVDESMAMTSPGELGALVAPEPAGAAVAVGAGNDVAAAAAPDSPGEAQVGASDDAAVAPAPGGGVADAAEA